MLEKIIRDFMTIWTTVDPISNLALFAGLTAAITAANVEGLPGAHLSTPSNARDSGSFPLHATMVKYYELSP